MRGYGYWVWKSYLNCKLLEKIDEGDIIFYMDAGCELKVEYFERMKEYIDIAKQSEKGIVAFKIRYLEKMYTKMDLIQYLDCYDHMDSEQIVTTAFVYRKSSHTEFIMKKWYEINSIYHLVDDSASIVQNDSTFIDHRHDQSIFSLLLKKYGGHFLDDELCPEINNCAAPIIKINNYSRIRHWDRSH